jgi:hypothetical protein
MKWLTIESAPMDGTLHVRGLYVYRPDGSLIGWEAWIGYVEDDGHDFLDSNGEHIGWEADHYSHWMPLPEPPTAELERTP